MEVTIEDADRVRTIDVPDSGQISIGRDLAGKKIRVAVEVVTEESEE